MPRSSTLTIPLPAPSVCQSSPTSSLRRSAAAHPQASSAVSQAPDPHLVETINQGTQVVAPIAESRCHQLGAAASPAVPD
jgi:hypothetical protein